MSSSPYFLSFLKIRSLTFIYNFKLNRMKKLYFFLLLSLFATFINTSRGKAQTLVVNKTDGTTIPSLLSGLRLMFSDGTISLTNSLGTVQYGMSDVTKFTFTSSSSSITNVIAPNLQLTVYPNPAREYIVLSGLERQAQIQIFRLDGILMKSLKNDDSSEQTLTITDLPSGIYLVKSNGEISKFIKR